MKNSLLAKVVAVGVFAVGANCKAVDWSQTAGGEFDFWDAANWNNNKVNTGSTDMRASITGDQTINISKPTTLTGAFFPGGSYDYKQIFTGYSLTAKGGNNRMMKGWSVFENDLFFIPPTSGNENVQVGLLQPAHLIVRDHGSITVGNKDIDIGVARSGSNGTGTLQIKNSAKATFTNAVAVAHSKTGSFKIDGGTVEFVGARATDSALMTIGRTTDCYGNVTMLGGEVSGETTISDTYLPRIGKYASADLFIEGGSWQSSLPVWIGGWETTAAVGLVASMTVAGNAEVSVKSAVFGNTCNNAHDDALNLNGGRLAFSADVLPFEVKGSVNRQWINFNGGTLALADAKKDATGWSDNSSIETVVYPQGGNIEINRSANLMRFKKAHAAKGCGVSAITLTNPGANYWVAPRVVISGGSGSNATAVAVMKDDHTIDRVVVTCPGEGYTLADNVTVSFLLPDDGGLHTAAAATVTLAEHGEAVLTKTGRGSWVQTSESTYDGVLRITRDVLSFNQNPNANATVGGSFPNATIRVDGGGMQVNVASGVTKKIKLKKYDHRVGVARVSLDMAEVTIDEVVSASSSSVSPVVHGFINTGSDKDSSPLFQRDADGKLEPVTLTDQSSATKDSNLTSTAAGTFDIPNLNKINSIILPARGVQYYFDTPGKIEIASGMIVNLYANPGGNVQRLATKNGGEFTTKVPAGLMIYGMDTGARDSGNGTSRRPLYHSFTDPDAQTHMPVSFVGTTTTTPDEGALGWLMGNTGNTFSGGVNLVNYGIHLYSNLDSVLGAPEGGLRVYGLCAISAAGDFALDANRAITLNPGSVLQFLQPANRTATINGSLLGEGDLLTGRLKNAASGKLRLCGNQSGFKGRYLVAGEVYPVAALSPDADIVFTGTQTGGAGLLVTSGTFERPLAKAKGGVYFEEQTAYGGGLRGGWKANDGDLTVDLGDTITVGSAALPSGASLYLQTDGSHAITLANPINLNGGTLDLYAGSGATLKGLVNTADTAATLAMSSGAARIAGELGGNMTIDGDVVLADGAKLKLAGSQLEVTGSLTAEDGVVVEFADDAETLAQLLAAATDDQIELGTVSVNGTLRLSTTLEDWSIAIKNGKLLLLRRQGMVLMIR